MRVEGSLRICFLLALAAAGCQFDKGGLAADGDASVNSPDADDRAIDGGVVPDADPTAPDADPTAPDAAATSPDASSLPPDASPPDAMPCPGDLLPITPSNINDGCDIPMPTGAWNLSGGDFVVNTDDLTIVKRGIVPIPAPTPTPIPAATKIISQTGGPDILVIAVDSLEISSTIASVTDVDFVGSRAVMLVSFGDINIDGRLGVDAERGRNGAGAGRTCGVGDGKTGVVVSKEGLSGGSGGSGGGFGNGGGGGAKVDEADGPNVAVVGGMRNGTLSMVPLRGGCRGGRGGNNGGDAGGAGGALQLVAAGSIRIERVVSARGGGGSGTMNNNAGGGGGGSGGGLLLEAGTAITIAGAVTANGGGGGEGSRSGGLFGGANGADGHREDMIPAAGATSSSAGGNGGDGSVRGTDAEDGSVGQTSIDNGGLAGGGGGGGGVGRLHLSAPSINISNSATASPQPL